MSSNSQKTLSVLSVLDEFMKKCKKLGWKIGEYRDFIKYEGEYYTFVWIKKSDKRIREILTSDKRSIFEDGRYKVDRTTYRALIFQDDPPQDIIRMIDSNLDLSKHVAIYNCSMLSGKKKVCIALNRTDNMVFSKFEDFLRELEISVKPLRALE